MHGAARRPGWASMLAGGVLLAAACAPVRNYLDPAGPRYETRHGDRRDRDPALRVVTFNVEKGRRVAQAVAALRGQPDLRDADVLVLQEMSAEGVAAMAETLRMNSVYFPASREPGGPDWGNAILSPWPIDDGRKLMLPHHGRVRRRARTATAARVLMPSGPVRVYSLHLGSPLDTSEKSRRDQAAAILSDAEGSPHPVVVAGDFNSGKLGRLFEERGYCWPTRDVGPTVHRWSVDHVFARGLCPVSAPLPGRAGVAREVEDASDHRPVWAVLAGPPATAAP